MKTSKTLHYFPTDYSYLLKTKTTTYNNRKLKTRYLMHLMHVLIYRKYIHKQNLMHLWSVILKKNYGTYYNYYVDWLIDHNFIKLKKKWQAGSSSKQYELTLNFNNSKITRVENDDKFLLRKLKKHEEDELIKMPPIYQLLQRDVEKIRLDYDGARESLDREHDISLIDDKSYFRNLMSLQAIKDHAFYVTRDEYGRLHTNFTNLKKNLRNNYLSIDGSKLASFDIKNCQPKLLASLIIKSEKTLTPGLKRFVDSVVNNKFYDSFKKFDLGKQAAKGIVYQIFFGRNRSDKNNLNFKDLWPDVWHWVVRIKREKRNHKYLSHVLQNMESDLVYNKICKEIKDTYPDVALFTVHDGIYFAEQHKSKVKPIFDKYEKTII